MLGKVLAEADAMYSPLIKCLISFMKLVPSKGMNHISVWLLSLLHGYTGQS